MCLFSLTLWADIVHRPSGELSGEKKEKRKRQIVMIDGQEQLREGGRHEKNVQKGEKCSSSHEELDDCWMLWKEEITRKKGGKMTNAPTLILEWEIDNPSVTLLRGVVESAKWDEGGFEWNAKITPSTCRDPYVTFALFCNCDRKGPFTCVAEIGYFVLRSDRSWRTYKNKMNLSENDKIWKLESCIRWRELSTEYNVNGKVQIEFRINILSSSGGLVAQADAMPDLDSLDLTKFISPIESSNVTLLIGDKTLVVSKEYLAMHSPVLNATFFGKFAENCKKEVEIKEVEYEEFLNLLLVFFPEPVAISDATILPITKLADRFQIKGVLSAAENHLISANKFSTVEKLQFADKYRFNKLRDTCLGRFRNVQELKIFKDSKLFDDFSDQLKGMICKRMIQLL